MGTLDFLTLHTAHFHICCTNFLGQLFPVAAGLCQNFGSCIWLSIFTAALVKLRSIRVTAFVGVRLQQ